MKAYFKLRKTFSVESPKPSTLLHIYNHTIRPILLYGSEIWGYIPHKKQIHLDNFISKETDYLVLEKIHTKLCKFSLGVNIKTSNMACRGELGSLPTLYYVIMNMVKYWIHLMKDIEPSNIILREAINLSHSMDKHNQESWIGSIKHIFKFLDLEYLFVNQSNFKKNHILKKVKTSLTIKFKESWLASLESNSGKCYILIYNLAIT